MIIASLLRQVLLNLLSNGIKFTAAGEVFLTVVPRVAAGPGATADGPSWGGEAARWARDEGAAGGKDEGLGGDNRVRGEAESLFSESLLFAVRDTGIGISADGRRKLFNRFSQAN